MAEYDRYAAKFSEQRAGASLNRLIEEPVVHELVGDPQGLRVLDAGCGDGSYCRWLAERGAKVVGIDASEALIHIARTHGDAIEYHVHDLNERLPFDEGSFDLVLCTLVTEYFEDLIALFTEFSRVLDTSGRIIVSCDHPFLSGVVKNDSQERVLSDYFSRTKRMYSWFGTDVPVYSHTLEDYFSALYLNGFSIDELREPTPVPSTERENPNLWECALKIPTILIIRGNKNQARETPIR